MRRADRGQRLGAALGLDAAPLDALFIQAATCEGLGVLAPVVDYFFTLTRKP